MNNYLLNARKPEDTTTSKVIGETESDKLVKRWRNEGFAIVYRGDGSTNAEVYLPLKENGLVAIGITDHKRAEEQWYNENANYGGLEVCEITGGVFLWLYNSTPRVEALCKKDFTLEHGFCIYDDYNIWIYDACDKQCLLQDSDSNELPDGKYYELNSVRNLEIPDFFMKLTQSASG